MFRVSSTTQQTRHEVHAIAPLAKAIYKVQILSQGFFYGFLIGFSAGVFYEITKPPTSTNDETLSCVANTAMTLIKTSSMTGITGSFLGTTTSYLLFKVLV